MRGYLLMGTRATDGGGRKNHGKPASPPTELGANKTSYASAKIGGHVETYGQPNEGNCPVRFPRAGGPAPVRSASGLPWRRCHLVDPAWGRR